MPIEINMPDGSVMNAPDDADPQEVKRRGNNYLTQHYGTTWFIGGHPAKKEVDEQGNTTAYSIYDRSNPGALKLRVPPSYNTQEIEEHLKNNPNVSDIDLLKTRSAAGYSHLPETIAKHFDVAQIYGAQNRAKTLEEEFPGLAKFALSGPAMTVGKQVAAATPGHPALKALTGGLAAAGTYLGGRKLIDPNDTPKQALLDSAISELPVPLIKGAISGGRAGWAEFTKPGSIVGEQIAKIGLTFSQVMKAMKDKDYPLLNQIENILATGTKKETVKNAANNINREAADISSKMEAGPGGTPQAIEPSVLKEKGIQDNVSKQINTLNDFSRDKANAAYSLAENSPFTTSSGNSVNGPIPINRTIQNAADFIAEYEKEALPSPADGRMYNESKRILTSTNAKLDLNGAVTSSDPISFKKAWQLKQDLQEAYKPAKSNDPPGRVSANRWNKEAFNNLNQDIEDGFSHPAWDKIGSIQTPTGPIDARYGDIARDVWKQSKAAVEQRWNNFGPDTIPGKILGLNEHGIPRSDPGVEIEKLWSKPEDMKRFLVTGEMKTPDGVVHVTNARQQAAALKVDKWWEDALKKGSDARNPANNGLDVSDILKDLKDPNQQIARKLLFTDGSVPEWEHLVTGLQKTEKLAKIAGISQTGMPGYGGSFYPIVRIVQGGLMIAPNVLTGTLHGSALSHGVIAGITLGTAGVAHLMAKPASARVLAAMANGQKLGSDEFIARVLINGLKGSKTIMNIFDDKGNKKQVMINPQGEAVSAEN